MHTFSAFIIGGSELMAEISRETKMVYGGVPNPRKATISAILEFAKYQKFMPS